MDAANKAQGTLKEQNPLTMETNFQLLPLIMDNIPQAVFWKDRDLVYLGCNQAFAEDAGLDSPEQIVGKTDFDMPWTGQAERYRSDDAQVMESGEAKINYEEPQTSPTGDTTWLRTSKIPLRNESGDVVAVLGMYEDITEYKLVQRVSAQSEQLLNSFINNFPDGVWAKDREGRFLLANRYIVEEIAGTEVIGKTVYDTMPKENADFVWASEKRLLENGEPIAVEEDVPHADGKIYKKITTKFPIYDTEGNISGVGGVLFDITERKQAEEALRQNEDRFRRFTEATAEGLVFHEEGKIVDANPAAITMFGYSDLSGIIGKNLMEFVLPEYHQLVLEKMQLESVEPYRIQGIHKDGHTFPIETSTRTYEADDKIIRATSVRDITRRQQVEQTLLESEERFRLFAEVTAEGLVFHEDGIVTDVNQALLNIFGYSEPSELIGQNLLEFITPELRTAAIQRLQEGTTEPFETNAIRKDGTIFPVETSAQVYEFQGEHKRVATIRDITERKRAEAQLERTLLETRMRYEVSQVLASAQTEEEVLDLFEQQVGIYPQAQVMLYTFDQQEDDVAVILRRQNTFESGMDFFMPLGTRFPAARFTLLNLLPADKPFISNDFPAEEHLDPASRQMVEQGGVNSLAIFPLTVGSDRMGFLIAATKLPNYFDETKQQLYQTLAELGTAALQTARLRDQIRMSYERRGYQVQVSTEIAQEIAAASELSDLFDRVVDLTKERLGYYHTQLLRYNPAQDAIVLVTGYGEIGDKMLVQGHRMPLGSGLIGTAAATGETMMRPDLANDPEWQPNPLLPETKGEVAVPIKLGDEIMGVLDVQSDTTNALTDDDRLLLEGLCGQIAIAMEQTRLRQEMSVRLEEINRLYRSMSREGWESYQATSDLPKGFQFDQAEVRALMMGETELESLVAAPLTVPGGHTVGTLAIANDPRNPLSPEDQTFLEQVSEQVALALESARLFEQTQASLAETQSLYRFNEAISSQAELEHIYQEVSQMVCKEVGFSGSWIAIYNPENETLQGVAGVNMPENLIRQSLSLDEKTPGTLAAQMRRTVIVNDPQKDKRMADIPADLLARMGKAIALPIMTGEELIGVIAATRQSGADIGDREERVFQIVADQLSIAIERTRLFEQTQSALEAVQESQEQLSEALEIAKLGYWEYDFASDEFILTDNFYAIFHTTAADMGGYRMSSKDYSEKFVHPEDSAMVGEEIGRAIATTDPHFTTQVEHRILYQDGGIGYISVNINLEKDEDGNILRWWGANQDITERWLAFNAVRESEAQLGEALEIAKLGYWEYDFVNDEFILTDNFYAIFHTTAADMGGYRMSSKDYSEKFVHPEDSAMVGEEIEKTLAVQELHFTTQVEHRILYQDGGVGYISVNINLEKDEDGNIIRWHGANQDITERWLAEEAVRESQQRAQTILETVTIPMVITRLSDNILTFANQPAVDLIGLPLDEFVNQPSPNFYYNPEEREAFVKELQEHGSVTNMQLRLMKSSSEPFWALVSARVFDYRGEPSILSTVLDISDRIEAQEATAKRAVELATVAELGTSISTVLEEQQLIETVVKLTRERFNLYHCHIFLADENNQTLQVRACGWEEDSPHIGTVEPVLIHTDQEQSLVARASRSQHAVIVNDVQADPDWLPNELLPSTRSEMAIPMIAGNQVLGVLDVQADETNRFDEEDISIMTTLASQVAVALQNARTYARTQQQAEHEAMINLISQRIQSTTSVENALQVAIRELGRALGAKRTNVQLGLPQQPKSDRKA